MLNRRHALCCAVTMNEDLQSKSLDELRNLVHRLKQMPEASRDEDELNAALTEYRKKRAEMYPVRKPGVVSLCSTFKF